jgi:hypothetical protein
MRYRQTGHRWQYNTAHAFACWIPKGTNTHSEYVIRVVYPWQQLLGERASMLLYTYVYCLSCSFIHSLIQSVSFSCSLSKYSAYFTKDRTQFFPIWDKNVTSQTHQEAQKVYAMTIYRDGDIAPGILHRGIRYSCSALLPNILTRVARAPGTHWRDGYVGLRAVRTLWETENSLSCLGNGITISGSFS